MHISILGLKKSCSDINSSDIHIALMTKNKKKKKIELLELFCYVCFSQ
jgi:hypothetical protein